MRAGKPTLSWEDFGRSRLSEFVRATDVDTLAGWEFLDRHWLGEAVGFTEWLRLEADPDVLRAVSLDLPALGDEVAERILSRLGSTLRPGMTRPEVESMLGPPTEAQVFPAAKDRVTLTYPAQGDEDYHLECTIHEARGLVYLVVLRGDWDRVGPVL